MNRHVILPGYNVMLQKTVSLLYLLLGKQTIRGNLMTIANESGRGFYKCHVLFEIEWLFRCGVFMRPKCRLTNLMEVIQISSSGVGKVETGSQRLYLYIYLAKDEPMNAWSSPLLETNKSLSDRNTLWPLELVNACDDEHMVPLHYSRTQD